MVARHVARRDDTTATSASPIYVCNICVSPQQDVPTIYRDVYIAQTLNIIFHNSSTISFMLYSVNYIDYRVILIRKSDVRGTHEAPLHVDGCIYVQIYELECVIYRV